MNTATHTFGRAPARAAAMFQDAWGAFAAMRQDRKDRKILASLSDRALEDTGLTRTGAEHVRRVSHGRFYL